MAALCVTGAVACFGLATWKARQYIQGYWFDRNSPGPHRDLTDCVTVVTGCSPGGLGLTAAILLAEIGAHVIVTTRSESKGQAAVKEIKSHCKSSSQRVQHVLLDLCSSASVRRAAEAIREEGHGRLDVLVMNAGSSSGEAPKVWQGNYLGHFLLVDLLRPALQQAVDRQGEARVVAVSSGAHKRAAIAWEDPFANESQKYGQSKLAQIMHMNELQRRSPSLRCVSVTPGFVPTNIMSPYLEKRGVLVRGLVACVSCLLGRGARTGAQVVKMAAAGDVPGGSYLSNCYQKPAQGRDGMATDPAACERLWELSQNQVAADRFP